MTALPPHPQNMASAETLGSVALFKAISGTFFILMLIIPTAYRTERMLILLAICAGIALKYMTTKRAYLSADVITIYFVTITASLLCSINGVMLNAPGAIASLTVFAVWPTLYITFMGMSNNPRSYAYLLKSVVIGALIASLSGITLVLSNFLQIGGILRPVYESLGAIVGIYDGTIEYSLPNITTAIYAVPFILAALSIRDQDIFSKTWKMMLWIALFTCLLSAILSGRRALLLVVMISPILILFLARMAKVRLVGVKNYIGTIIVAAILGVFIAPALGLRLDVMAEEFLTGFNLTLSGSSESSYLRAAQLDGLLKSWSERPIFGHGLGASSSYIVRNDEMPWAYELGYLALLFQTGVFGISIYTAAVSWIFIKGVSIMRKNAESRIFLLPTISALACFLIANATNPYLNKFDYLWTLFLPVGILNAFQMEKNR